jgi:hypothetical protein
MGFVANEMVRSVSALVPAPWRDDEPPISLLVHPSMATGMPNCVRLSTQ